MPASTEVKASEMQVEKPIITGSTYDSSSSTEGQACCRSREGQGGKAGRYSHSHRQASCWDTGKIGSS
ncbi:hypothetical protein E2562_006834 [Oryza meyeriana var. granulata]|uniref:Uncharacterized protein n=1 Tax=Oryza meyeriana var. granulata TaxID=110450 RepID=A0A6G1C4G4_9ORYZ|nr:hypothetical protein E2562_006834 [Oryza meyeriana var. granulata]